MKELLTMKLIKKSEAVNVFEHLLPFLLHPNTWIRAETRSFILFLADPLNNYFSKGEAFCKLRPKLLKYLKTGYLVFDMSPEDFRVEKLREPFDRESYQKFLDPASDFHELKAELRGENYTVFELMENVLVQTRQYKQTFERGVFDKNQAYQQKADASLGEIIKKRVIKSSHLKPTM